ncbi:hypothetical protein NDU88_002047 [Pleurodeles waltl]|uniref:Uncharacterized protein n=1 Tax=Pleurodeles waltl TaxID=8319 RepID=A0AAV7T1M3_PLEWA|nr:hypothetical protein NDU88_002047 [Pleurodeles waltl]
MPQTQVLIACVHGDQSYYPVARIRFQWRGKEETLRVGVLPHLEEDIIIGTDYAAFPRLLNKAREEHMMKKWWEEIPYDTEIAETRPLKPHLSKRQKRAQSQQHWEENQGNTDPPGITGKVCTVAGDFRQKQREDPSLKNAWEKALSREEEGVGPTFHIHNDLLYRTPQSGNMNRRQLLVPGSYREQVLQFAHGDTGEGISEETRPKQRSYSGFLGQVYMGIYVDTAKHVRNANSIIRECNPLPLYNPSRL